MKAGPLLKQQLSVSSDTQHTGYNESRGHKPRLLACCNSSPSEKGFLSRAWTAAWCLLNKYCAAGAFCDAAVMTSLWHSWCAWWKNVSCCCCCCRCFSWRSVAVLFWRTKHSAFDLKRVIFGCSLSVYTVRVRVCLFEAPLLTHVSVFRKTSAFV